MTTRYHAVIGARLAGPERMHAAYMTARDVVPGLASGNADDIDLAAKLGAWRAGKDVFTVLPWESYNREWRLPPGDPEEILYVPANWDELAASVNAHHPRPDLLSQGAFKQMARNVVIIRQSDEVHAWPLDVNDETGGTWFGIHFARALGIPVHVAPAVNVMSDPEFLPLLPRWRELHALATKHKLKIERAQAFADTIETIAHLMANRKDYHA